PQRDVVLVGDGQRFGWADEGARRAWPAVAEQLRKLGDVAPRLWYVNLDPRRPANPPNWSLAPLRASRAVASAGQLVTCRAAPELPGREEYNPPFRIRLEVDGRPQPDLPAPSSAKPLPPDPSPPRGEGRVTAVPLTFAQRFPAAGSHLLSVTVEPDPPP